MTAQSDPSREPFEKFLLWLSLDRDRALQRYAEIMRKIGKFFVRKGCLDSEELSAETRDRVVRIVSASLKEYPNCEALFYSVAAKVYWEYRRKPQPEPLPPDDLLPVYEQKTEEKELQAHCLEKCLTQLLDWERDLITRYYQNRGFSNSEARKQLIAEHGEESTLRVKAFRIRAKLRICINACKSQYGK